MPSAASSPVSTSNLAPPALEGFSLSNAGIPTAIRAAQASAALAQLLPMILPFPIPKRSPRLEFPRFIRTGANPAHDGTSAGAHS
jgi:hypothetical protein